MSQYIWGNHQGLHNIISNAYHHVRDDDDNSGNITEKYKNNICNKKSSSIS